MYYRAGRFDDTENVVRSAVEQSAERAERAFLAHANRVLGEILAGREPASLVTAERYYLQALALGREPGLQPLQARCYLGLGTLYRRIGRLEEARAELATAISMLRERALTFWLPEAEMELAEVRE